jgi:hypothetical protein
LTEKADLCWDQLRYSSGYYAFSDEPDNKPANQGMPIHTLTQGGNIMSESLTILARKIQEVLAGKMTPEQFCNEYARPNSPFENPFLRALKVIILHLDRIANCRPI